MYLEEHHRTFHLCWLLLPPKLPKSNLTTITTHHVSKPYHTFSKSGSPSLPYSLTETVSSQLLFFASIVYHFHRIADLMLPPPPSLVSNDRPLPRHRYKHKHTYSLNKKYFNLSLTSHQNLQTSWSETIVRHHTLSHRPSQSRFIVSHHNLPPFLSIFFPLFVLDFIANHGDFFSGFCSFGQFWRMVCSHLFWWRAIFSCILLCVSFSHFFFTLLCFESTSRYNGLLTLIHKSLVLTSIDA